MSTNVQKENALRHQISGIGTKLSMALKLRDFDGVTIYKHKLRRKQEQLKKLVELRPYKGG